MPKSWFLVIPTLIVAVLAATAEAQPAAPVNVYCIEVGDGAVEVLIAGNGHVSERLISNEREVAITDFSPVERLEGRALIAGSGQRLIVRPENSDVVFTYRSGEMSRLFEDETLLNAIALAVGTDGTVAAIYADPPRIRTFTISAQGEVGHMEVALRFLPEDVAIDRYGVLLVDGTGTMVRLAEAALGSDTSIQDRVSLPPIAAVAEYGGLVYGTSGERLAVATGHDFGTWAVAPLDFVANSGRPGLTRAHMFIPDADHGIIHVRERIVPVTVSFRSDTTNLAALASTYRLLIESRLLVTAPVIADRDYTTLEQFLFERGVIIPSRAVRAEGELAKDPAAGMFRSLICSWHPALCTTGDDVLTRPVAKNETIELPVMNRRRSETLATVKLGKETVEEHLLMRLNGTRSRWTAARLAAINPSYTDTVEGYFNRLGFVLTTPPRAAFGPGTMFWTENGTEHLALMCENFDLPVSNPRPLLPPPLTLRTSAPELLIPREKPIDPAALARSRIDQAEIRYDDVRIESLDDSVDIGRLAERFATCFRDAGGDAHVVRHAVRVGRTLVRFFDRSGKPVCPRTNTELAQLGFAGRLADTTEWCVSIPLPFYIAYRADRWTTPKPMPESRIFNADVSSIKAGSQQDFLAARLEEVILPIDRWQLVIPATVGAVATTSSPLLQLQEQYAMDVRSNAPIVSSRPMSAPDESAGEGPIDEASVHQRVADICDEIACVDEPDGEVGQPPIIGLVEATKSVEFEHPEFFDGVGSIWVDIGPEGSTPHVAQPLAVTMHEIRQNDVGLDEHGTHVAGIIAAQRADVLRSLFPRARLGVIDRELGPEDIVAALRNAYEAGARVFGFSLGYEGHTMNDVALAPLREYFKDVTYKALYVVAAGNDGLDLREVRNDSNTQPSPFPYPPIAWLSPAVDNWKPVLAQRMIGVGAWDGQALWRRSKLQQDPCPDRGTRSPGL